MGGSVEEENLDIHVQCNDGRRFAGTLYTLRNLQFLMDKFRVEGECAKGRYFFDPSMVIIRDLNADTIREVIADLVRTGDIEKAFVVAVPPE